MSEPRWDSDNARPSGVIEPSKDLENGQIAHIYWAPKMCHTLCRVLGLTRVDKAGKVIEIMDVTFWKLGDNKQRNKDRWKYS